MTDEADLYWCLTLGPTDTFSIPQGQLFESYADLMAYLKENGLEERAQLGEITLLVHRGIPEGIGPFLPLLRPEQRP